MRALAALVLAAALGAAIMMAVLGRYEGLVSGEGGLVWVLNRWTGDVKPCLYGKTKCEPWMGDGQPTEPRFGGTPFNTGRVLEPQSDTPAFGQGDQPAFSPKSVAIPEVQGGEPQLTPPIGARVTKLPPLEQFRQLYPVYANIPDAELADLLYGKFYKDHIDRAEFDRLVFRDAEATE